MITTGKFMGPVDVSSLPPLDQSPLIPFARRPLGVNVDAAGRVVGFPINRNVRPVLSRLQVDAPWARNGDRDQPNPAWLAVEAEFDHDCLAVLTDGRVAEMIGVNTGFMSQLPTWLGGGGGLPIVDNAVMWDADLKPRVLKSDPNWPSTPVVQGIVGARWPLTPLVLTATELAAGMAAPHPVHLMATIGTKDKGWPAQFSDGPLTSGLRYGSWLRLRANYPTAGLRPAALTVVRTLQIRGCILGDSNGGNQSCTLTTEPFVDPAAILQISAITLADMTLVDTTQLRANQAAIGDPAYFNVRT